MAGTLIAKAGSRDESRGKPSHARGASGVASGSAGTSFSAGGGTGNSSATRQRNPGTTSSPESSSSASSQAPDLSPRQTWTVRVSGSMIQTSFTPARKYSPTFSTRSETVSLGETTSTARSGAIVVYPSSESRFQGYRSLRMKETSARRTWRGFQGKQR